MPAPAEVAKMAEAYMRTAGTAIREMPIVQRTPPVDRLGHRPRCRKGLTRISRWRRPQTALSSSKQSALGRDVQIGETLSLVFSQGRPSIASDRGRDR